MSKQEKKPKKENSERKQLNKLFIEDLNWYTELNKRSRATTNKLIKNMYDSAKKRVLERLQILVQHKKHLIYSRYINILTLLVEGERLSVWKRQFNDSKFLKNLKNKNN